LIIFFPLLYRWSYFLELVLQRSNILFFLCGGVVTTDNDALDSGSHGLVLMQGTTRIWKSGIEFFLASQFCNESSLGIANEADTVDGPSGLEVKDSAVCF
jgi:hypothetical protein